MICRLFLEMMQSSVCSIASLGRNEMLTRPFAVFDVAQSVVDDKVFPTIKFPAAFDPNVRQDVVDYNKLTAAVPETIPLAEDANDDEADVETEIGTTVYVEDQAMPNIIPKDPSQVMPHRRIGSFRYLISKWLPVSSPTRQV